MVLVFKMRNYLLFIGAIYVFGASVAFTQCTGASCGASCGMASSTSGSCGSSCGMNAKGSGCGTGMSCGSQSTTSSMSCCSGMASGCGSASCGSSGGCGGAGSCGSMVMKVSQPQSPKIIADKGCGGRSLAYIASRQGIKMGESEIVKMIHYDPDKGASMMDIVTAAKKLGLESSGYKMNYAQLEKRELPVIVSLPDHFTVLVSMDKSKNTLTFTDSSKKKVTMTHEEFLKQWKGYVLEIRKQSAISLVK